VPSYSVRFVRSARKELERLDDAARVVEIRAVGDRKDVYE
jgi:hypothetical protein